MYLGLSLRAIIGCDRRHNMGQPTGAKWPSALWILGSFALPIAIASCIYASITALRLVRSSTTADAPFACQTIIADPNPPLNVRSSPVVANNNRITSLPNGTLLTIADENAGWLKIDSPVQGWVYKELTVTSCSDTSTANHLPQGNRTQIAPDVNGTQLLAIAMEQYQAGNLNGAIALAQSITKESKAYQAAQLAIHQWPQQWHTAEAQYYAAQKAVRDGEWAIAIQVTHDYPEIRYWKEKLAPLVQRAIHKRHN